MQKLFLDELIIQKSIKSIVDQIKNSNFIPDILLSVGRGGMIPTRYISDYMLSATLSYIPAQMYTGIGTTQKQPSIGQLSIPVFQKNVLIIDDIVDSGLTVDSIINVLKINQANQIKVATIAVKEYVKRLPSFYSLTIKTNEWVVFPWERNEFKNN